MKQPDFGRMTFSAAAQQWGVAAADAARGDGKRISANTLDRWLDQTDQPTLGQSRTETPALPLMFVRKLGGGPRPTLSLGNFGRIERTSTAAGGFAW